jgi:hypothetical protein
METSPPLWDQLRAFGNSKAVQLSVLFPLVGYLILINDEVAKFLTATALDRTVANPSLLNSVWNGKLYFIYFGLMALGIGSAFYQYACPHIVKKHGDDSDLIRMDGDTYSHEELKQLGAKVNIHYDRQAYGKDLSESVGGDILRAFYKMEAKSSPKYRFVVTGCFLIGTTFLAVPSTTAAIKIITHVASAIMRVV